MIRITKTSKPSKRKNPHLEDIEEFIENNSSKFKYLNKGVEGKVYYFKLNRKLMLNTEILQPGEYVLKILHEGKKYSLDHIDQLKLFSKYGLVPKVFVVTKQYVVMKYIRGTTLKHLEKSLKQEEIWAIDNKVEKLHNIWKKLGFQSYIDPNEANVLVSDDMKHVYIIDPFLIDDMFGYPSD